jgi:hypothetical protein
MNDQVLNLELRLLILRYSRRRIIDSLAKLGDQTPEEIERELTAVSTRKAQRVTKPKVRPSSDLIADACRDRPEVMELVTTLVNRFENLTFLPQRRDVVRFFDRLGISHGTLKSRRISAAAVISALAGLELEELKRLASPPAADSESDLAVLAREIMAGGRSRRPPKQASQ